MKDKKNWVIVALLLSMLAGVVYAIWEGDRLALEKEKALADLQQARLESAGWMKSTNDLEGELDLLREKLEAAREVGSEPAVRVQVVTREVPVRVPGEAIPCPPPMPPESNETRSAAPVELPLGDSSSPSLNLPSLFVSARTQLAIDLLADSSLTWVGSTEVSLRRNGDESKVVLPIDPDDSALQIGDTLRTLLEQRSAKRIAFGLRRPRFWRLGWTAGVGVACHLDQSSLSISNEYEGALSKSASRCGPSVGVGWGVQF